MQKADLLYKIGDKIDYVIPVSRIEEVKGCGVIVGSPVYSLHGKVIVVYNPEAEKFTVMNQTYITKIWGSASLEEVAQYRSRYADGPSVTITL